MSSRRLMLSALLFCCSVPAAVAAEYICMPAPVCARRSKK